LKDNKQEALVSVCMITYKHEKYLEAAIEGVLMQETDFEFELLIANDNSPDNTDKIVREYISSHPKGYRIKYFKHEKNLGMMPNALFALRKCQRKYIASCEGDDYWIDKYKLQKQVDFLEQNPDFAICSTNAYVINEFNNFEIDTNYPIVYKEIESHEKYQSQFLENNCILTLTTVFRNNIKNYPEWLHLSPIGDWCMHILNTQYGRVWYMNDITAVYRNHSGGVFSQKSQQQQLLKCIDTCELLIENLPKFRKELIQGQRERILQLLNIWDVKNDKNYFGIILSYRKRLFPKDIVIFYLKGLKNWLRNKKIIFN